MIRFLLLPLFVVLVALGGFVLFSQGEDGFQAFDEGNYAIALEELTPIAEQGYDEAQYVLGQIYEKGLGVAKDGPEARKWYQLAADQGHEGAWKKLAALGSGKVSSPETNRPQSISAKIQKPEIKNPETNTPEIQKPETGSAKVNNPEVTPENKGETLPVDAKNPDLSPEIRSGLKAYLEGDKKTARKILAPLAEGGHPSAQYVMGQMWMEENAENGDFSAGLKWFERSADQGYHPSQFMLGMMYENGLGVASDLERAVKLYQLAADQGNEYAITELARINDQAGNPGSSKPEPSKNPEPSREEEEQDGKVQLHLGFLSEAGDFFPKDIEAAVEFYKQSSDFGNVDAQNYLGKMYETGDVIPRDLAEAAKYYQLAADQGDEEAQQALARLGKATPKPAKERAEIKNPDLADLPNLDAEYEKFLEVFKTKDYDTAVTLVRPLVNAGHAKSQFSLGLMYRMGFGVPKDSKKAAKWIGLAAEQGNAAYQNEMGRLYEKGIGVPENSKTAAKWYRLAADQGYGKAKQNLRRIESAEGNSEDQVGENKAGLSRVSGAGSPTVSGPGYQEAQEALENEDYFTALEILLPLAEEGSAEAQSILGNMYRKGLGVGKDYSVAAKWYRRAAEQGNEEGAKELALLQNKAADRKLKPEVAPANDNIAPAAKKKKTALSAGVREGRQAYESGDFFTALEQLLPLAEEGAAEAQFILGNMYRKGLGVGKDSSVALQWTTAAAQQGHGDAQYNLGLIYQFGFGLEKDRNQAVKWYQRAAGQGHAGALKNLSRMGVAQSDLTQDRPTGNTPKKQAVQKEQNTAVLSVPKPRSKPKAIPQRRVENTAAKKEKLNLSANSKKGWKAYFRADYTTAIKEWTPLAEQGNGRAQYLLGQIYYKGKGVPQDYETAARWTKLSAEQGYAEAQNQLGIMYEEGRGVPQNQKTAIKYFRRAAKKWNAKAELHLAMAYKDGRGVPRDYKLAAKWYRLAAEQGEDEAQYVLGRMYYHGTGVGQNYKEAFRWTKLAAEQGDRISQLNLGLMYAFEIGVKKDLPRGYMWIDAAALQGNKNAKKERDSLAEKMSSAQLKTGQRLSRECVARNYKKC